ncbi:hypothetical protein LIG30_4557 [Burkholderia sp. lig30]|jgi:hypothetical protein|nr:hypothetical protein LIG30_4557 [Burkholderia sp. lig30]
MAVTSRMQTMREQAAASANAEDASIWRWMSALIDERRIRWCYAAGKWLVSVDHRHVATDDSFDRAIRTAKENAERGTSAAGRRGASVTKG